jgi:hypothetical protein
MFVKMPFFGAASVRAASQMARTAGSKVQKRNMSVPIHPGPTGPDKRLVLAYSGGLDTSTQLRWLADKGYEVIAFCANLGQGGGMNDEDFSGIEKKALSSGAKKCYVLDLQEDFVENYVFPVLRSSALYESRYMMGTSLARPCITKTLVRLYKFATRKALYFFLLPLLSSLSPSSLPPEGCTVQKMNFSANFSFAGLSFSSPTRTLAPISYLHKLTRIQYN